MSDVQVQIWYSQSPLHLDFVEESPVTLQIEFRYVKNAADPRKRIILGHNKLNKQYKSWTDDLRFNVLFNSILVI